MKKHKFGWAIATLIVAALIAGCATTTNLPREANMTPEALKTRALERASERWKLMNNKDYSKAYKYLSASTRENLTSDSYSEAQQKMGIIQGQPKGEISCATEICTVPVEVTFYLQIPKVGPRPQTVSSIEHWILVNGELWLTRR